MSHVNVAHNFSIIVPTFHEANNITTLVNRIAQVDFGNRQFETIFIDDNSEDGIIDIINQLQTTYPWLKLIVRYKTKSLSAAVIEGFQQATYPTLVIMDAHLSHPPEKIPALLCALEETGTDMVIGSRYIMGGSMDRKWPITRQCASRLSAFAANLLLSMHLNDPLSGFIAIKKTTLHGASLKTTSWKIGLEIIVKCHCTQIKEIPIHFANRLHGKSKLSLFVVFNYLRHINNLFFYKIFLQKK